MNYSIRKLITGVAQRLSGLSLPIYIAPTQQKADVPCFFICLMPGDFKTELSKMATANVNLDIVYLQSPNIQNAMNGIYNVIDYLDSNLETINYIDGEESTLLSVFDRKHHLEEMDLHYQISLHVRVSLSEIQTFMKELEVDYEVKTRRS